MNDFLRIIIYIIGTALFLALLSLISTGFAILHQIVYRLICCIFPKFSNKEPSAFLDGIMDKSTVITFAFVLYLFGSYFFNWNFLEASEFIEFVFG